MATTTFREDFLGQDLVAPTVNSLDFLGRATTSTTDFLGRPLRRVAPANTTAVTLNQEIQFTGGEKFIVTVAGTTAASPLLLRRWVPPSPTVSRRYAGRSAAGVSYQARELPW